MWSNFTRNMRSTFTFTYKCTYEPLLTIDALVITIVRSTFYLQSMYKETLACKRASITTPTNENGEEQKVVRPWLDQPDCQSCPCTGSFVQGQISDEKKLCGGSLCKCTSTQVVDLFVSLASYCVVFSCSTVVDPPIWLVRFSPDHFSATKAIDKSHDHSLFVTVCSHKVLRRDIAFTKRPYNVH